MKESIAKHSYCPLCTQWRVSVAVQAGRLLQLQQFQNKAQKNGMRPHFPWFSYVSAFRVTISFKTTWRSATLQIVLYNFLPFYIDGRTYRQLHASVSPEKLRWKRFIDKTDIDFHSVQSRKTRYETNCQNLRSEKASDYYFILMKTGGVIFQINKKAF